MLKKTHGLAILAVLTTLIAACTPDPVQLPVSGTTGNPASVWSIDLIRTLPGMQATYLESIQANWAGARALALRDGHILSYTALATASDSTGNWDVILLTEYPDSIAYEQREDTFRAIFESPEYVASPSAVPSSEMRAFFSSERPFRNVAGSGG